VILPASQISYRKRIGTSGDKSVFGVGLIGGLHLVVLAKQGGFETLGAGSHPAVARYLAQRNAPDLKYDELMKGSQPTYADFKDLLPKYELITNQMRELQGY
jgi:hypothetical protein